MENQRAMRRAQVQRLKKNRARWWGRDLSPKEKGLAVNTPTVCSCSICGNPRKYSGERTVQECRQLQDVD